jgi:siderophore synthetase component
MSLRTLALVGQPDHHVKTALAVQMTSAVRVVSPSAVHNGPLLSELLQRLAHPTLRVIAESAGAVVGDDGHLAVIHRRLPRLAATERAVPLAVLAAPSPATGRPVATELGDPLTLVSGLARLALPPLLDLLAQGVALEAHGQNLLVVLRGDVPVRLLYRDLGGVRVSPARLRRAGIDPPPLRGSIVEDDPDPLRDKLFASFVGTVLTELITVLERERGLDPAAAWRAVGQVVRAQPGADAKALLVEDLPVKAMTAMRLADDPLLDLWARVENPMAQGPA